MHTGVWRTLAQIGCELPHCVSRTSCSYLDRAVREISYGSSETEAQSLPNRPPAVSDALYPAADAIIYSLLFRLVQAGYLRMFAAGSGDQTRMHGKGRATG